MHFQILPPTRPCRSSSLFFGRYDDFFSFESYFRKCCAFAIGTPITCSCQNYRMIAEFAEAKDLIVLSRLKSFHGACVDPHHRRDGHELSQHNVDLIGCPVLDVEVRR